MNPFTKHIITMEGGAELHTRKGWRGPSRPAGTNRRRRLTRIGLQSAPLSRGNRLLQAASNPSRSLWGRAKAYYNGWLVALKQARIEKAQEEAALAAAIAAEAAAKKNV